MNSFLEYFHDELYYLKELIAEFGQDYLEIAEMQHLLDSDPDIAYLIEHFAFLSARLRRKLEDGFPEITQNLLSRIWSLPLQPLPPATIVQFTLNDQSSISKVPAGAQISAANPALPEM